MSLSLSARLGSALLAPAASPTFPNPAAFFLERSLTSLLRARRSLKKAAGIDHTLPKELQDHPELKLPENKLDTAEEADVARCPPDPQYPAGVLSVIVHHLTNVESQNLKGASGRHREGAAGQDTDEPSEQGDNVVSTYVEYVLNDDLIYKYVQISRLGVVVRALRGSSMRRRRRRASRRPPASLEPVADAPALPYRTRTKIMSSLPYFEAGTEAFVRDYRKATLRLVVRDARLREHDPILGIINLPLNEVFAHSSQVTRTYSLRDGVGLCVPTLPPRAHPGGPR